MNRTIVLPLATALLASLAGAAAAATGPDAPTPPMDVTATCHSASLVCWGDCPHQRGWNALYVGDVGPICVYLPVGAGLSLESADVYDGDLQIAQHNNCNGERPVCVAHCSGSAHGIFVEGEHTGPCVDH